MLAFPCLFDVANDPAADGIKRILILRLQYHQRLFRLVGETSLDYEADGDLVPFIKAVTLDEPVHQGTFLYHTRHTCNRRMKEGGLVLRVLLIALFQVGHQLGRVDLITQIDFTVGPFGTKKLSLRTPLNLENCFDKLNDNLNKIKKKQQK